MMLTRPARESGFLLVGVVMFVLALTILGLSLYALSSYEADFEVRSHNDTAALYSAQGGIEMVLQLLQLNWQLNDALLAVGHEGVDSVYVSQSDGAGGQHTTGPINYSMNDSLATVTVLAHAGSSTRKLVAVYRPGPHVNYYTRLFTIAGTIDVELSNPGSPPTTAPTYGTFHVLNPDSSWTNDPDQTWVGRLSWPTPARLRPSGGVPVPDVVSFLQQHPPAACFAPVASNHTLIFDQHSGNGYDYYYQPQGPDPNYTLSNTPQPPAFITYAQTLSVSGTAIWLLPHGLYTDGPLQVNLANGTAATIVIVGSPKLSPPSATPGYGLFLHGGLNVDPRVSVFLVTDGLVCLEQWNDWTDYYSAPSLSIYCAGLLLRGPLNPKHSDLGYDDATMNPIIFGLEQNGALPAGTGAPPTAFTFLKGSWRDLTP